MTLNNYDRRGKRLAPRDRLAFLRSPWFGAFVGGLTGAVLAVAIGLAMACEAANTTKQLIERWR